MRSEQPMQMLNRQIKHKSCPHVSSNDAAVNVNAKQRGEQDGRTLAACMRAV